MTKMYTTSRPRGFVRPNVRVAENSNYIRVQNKFSLEVSFFDFVWNISYSVIVGSKAVATPSANVLYEKFIFPKKIFISNPIRGGFAQNS